METHTLRVWRQIRELSVEELAEKTRLHPVTIRNHETGYLKMSENTKRNYAYTLGVQVEQIDPPKREVNS